MSSNEGSRLFTFTQIIFFSSLTPISYKSTDYKSINLNITTTSDEAELCKRLLPYRAEVTFRMATDTVSVTVRSKRLTFFDKLSAFGMLNSLL